MAARAGPRRRLPPVALTASAAAVRAAAQAEAHVQERRVAEEQQPIVRRRKEGRQGRPELVPPAQRGNKRARHPLVLSEDVRKGERATRPSLHGVEERVGLRDRDDGSFRSDDCSDTSGDDDSSVGDESD